MTAQPYTGTPTPVSFSPTTGLFSPGASDSKDALVPTYSNTTTTGFYAVPAFGSEYVDWGVKVGGGSGWSDSMMWGYATTILDPGAGGPGASFWVTAMFGTTGFGNPGIKAFAQPVIGAPGSADGTTPTGFLLSFDNCASMVFLPDGPIGYSFTNCDGASGPLLAAVGCCGTSTVDSMDQWVAPATLGGTFLGTFSFTTAGIASLIFEMTEDDGSTPATAAVSRNSVLSPNPSVFSETSIAKYNANWNTSIVMGPTDFATVMAVSVGGAFDIPVPGLGAVLINITPPNPIIIDVAAGSHTFPIPADCSLSGIKWSAQGVTVDIGGGLTLTNALDFSTGA
jgi:hypothetical protein